MADFTKISGQQIRANTIPTESIQNFDGAVTRSVLLSGIISGFVSSSAQVNTGSFSGSFTGNVIGTSSWANNVTSASVTSRITGGTANYIPLWTGSSNNELTSSVIYQLPKGIFIGYDTTPHVHSPEGETLAVHSGETGVRNVIYAHGTIDSDYRVNIRNISSGVSASTNYKATADTGNDIGGFIEMGINSSTYARLDQIGGPLDAYLFSTGSDLLIGTLGPDSRIILFSGPGDADNNARVYVDAGGTVGINTNSITTGDPESLYVGALNTSSINLITAVSNVNNYSQVNLTNQSAGDQASADFVATANNGTETTNFINMGINSSDYAVLNAVGGPNDAYLYSTGRMLHIGNTTPDEHIMFFVGGEDAEANTKLILESNNQHVLSGSLNVTGSINVLPNVINNLTSSFAISASFAPTILPNGLVSSSTQINTGSFSGSFTGTLIGTSSWASNSVSASAATSITFTPTTASFAQTASFLNILNQTVSASGNIIAGTNLISNNSSGDEGGEILLAKPQTNSTIAGTGVTIDIFQNKLRFFEQGGSARGFFVDMTSGSGAAGTNLQAAASAVSSYTNATDNRVITSTGAGGINAESTLTYDGTVLAISTNGAKFFQGGDDAALYDVNTANTLGIHGQQDSTVGAIKLGSSGQTIYSNTTGVGIGTITPGTLLHVQGNVSASSFTGSLFGTSSWASNSVSSSFATSASAANSITFTPATASFATTASYALNSAAGGLTGGTTNYIPLWTSATAQSSSNIFQSTNNIGIGTTSATQRLTVSGSVTIPLGTAYRINDTWLIGKSSVTNAISIGADNVTSDIYFNSLAASTPSNTPMFIAGTGNVGISTLTPTQKLEVSGSITIPQGGAAYRANNNWLIGQSTNTNTISFGSSNVVNDFEFYSNSPTIASKIVFFVSTSGDVGVGGAVPRGSRLHVQGNVSASSYTSSISNAVGFFGTASWALNAASSTPFPYDGRTTPAVISGSLIISGSTTQGLFVTGSTTVLGAFQATTKSFRIDHQRLAGKSLIYGVLEGPEHAVYARGRTTSTFTGTAFIQLPEEWEWLVDAASITVQLTPISGPQEAYVDKIENNMITIKSRSAIDCFYLVHATRKDVPNLITVE